MKLTVGYLRETWGEVYFDGQRITYSGPEPNGIRNMLKVMSRKGQMTDSELFFSLPIRCHHYQWASGITNDDGTPVDPRTELGWLPARFFGERAPHEKLPRDTDYPDLVASLFQPERTEGESDNQS